jgi:hypothetical protein
MKKLIQKSIGTVLFIGTLLTANTVLAQTSVITTSPITSMGTISEFNPQTIIVKTETGTSPVSYSYSKTTTYVDEAGNPVSMTTVKSGLPVTVYYTKSGDTMTATKVIVRKAVMVPGGTLEERKTTTTTTETK